MENKEKNEYEFYIRKYNLNNIEIEEKIKKDLYYSFFEIGIPFKIVAKAGMKTLAEWEMSKVPSDELIKKYNIDLFDADIKSVLPSIIEENYNPTIVYYSELEKKLLRMLLSKYSEVSDDKLNEIFGYEDFLYEIKNTIQPINITQFKLLATEWNEIGYNFNNSSEENKVYYGYELNNSSEENTINFEKVINELYSSAIINGQAGELDIWEDNDGKDKHTKYYSVENLLGLNREELAIYDFIYSAKSEELKGKEYIIFVILDRLREFHDRVLYFAPIEYPKDSDLNFIQIIENYIYNTFYTVSEPIQRRYITFLQRYCNENQKQYTKIKNNNNF